MFANLKLRNRILLGYSVPIVLMMGLGGTAYLSASKVQATLKDIDNSQQAIVRTDDMTIGLLSLASAVRGYLLNHNEQLLTNYASDTKLIQDGSERASKLSLSQEQKERLTRMLEIATEYQQVSEEIVNLAKQGKQTQAVALFSTGKGAELLDEFDALNTDFNAAAEKYLDEVSGQAAGNMGFLVSAALLGTLLAIAVAITAAYLISSGISKMLTQASSAIASSSTEIATTVEQQERTISQQASSVTQTTTTMDELGASSRQSAEQAEDSASGARQALALAEDGTKAVQETLEGMSTLKDKVGAIAEQILRLSEQTQQIGGISSLVGDLANQTNMLALNAAVEAARAGEHGKGFGVVAGEIRKLADQSKKSAEKINVLVGDIQAAINTTVMVTDEGTKNVDSGMKLTQSTAETFTGVADAVNNVFLNSQQISLSAKQQAVAVQQVVAAMNEINLGAKETASGITQVKVSTQQLSNAAHKLKAVV
jgi:methyl-accepting chemotaxis protein